MILTSRQTGRRIERQTGIHTYRQGRQTNTLPDRQTGMQTYRRTQTERLTHTLTDTQSRQKVVDAQAPTRRIDSGARLWLASKLCWRKRDLFTFYMEILQLKLLVLREAEKSKRTTTRTKKEEVGKGSRRKRRRIIRRK